MSGLRAHLVGLHALVALTTAPGGGSEPAPAGVGPAESPARQAGAEPGATTEGGNAGLGGVSAAPTTTAGGGLTKHAYPVQGNKGSYAREHHDYPASDIIADCGLTAVSPVDGTVLEVARTDTYNAKVNDGATRGGLSLSILGADGARYYMSHFSSIDSGIAAGVAVKAGQPVAKIGRTGDAGACHIHFGLSPACQKTGDWWTRRGVIWPWSYLDAWKAGKEKSPVAELEAWQQRNGCPAKPTGR
jgi:peptidoglycan LD-endopeptidase LytH